MSRWRRQLNHRHRKAFLRWFRHLGKGGRGGTKRHHKHGQDGGGSFIQITEYFE